MDVLDFFWHLAGFIAPALVMALGMVSLSRFLGRNRPSARSWKAQAAINFVVCLLVLLLGLVLTEHDGRMNTYAALVLASATCQAWLTRRG